MVKTVGAGIPDMGKGQGDDLPAVGRVGEDFLVARHGGVEDHFANSLARSADGNAAKNGAICKGQQGRLCRHNHLESAFCAGTANGRALRGSLPLTNE